MKLTLFRTPKPSVALAALLLPVGIALAVLSGCGGGGNQDINAVLPAVTGSPATTDTLINTAAGVLTGTTRATVAIQWPVRPDTRLVPVASGSIRVTISNAAGFSATQIIARPASSAVFENLPPGDLSVNASAHADAAGTATPAQAVGSQVVNAVADQPFAINLTLNSTIDRVSVTQSATMISPAGETATFTASALDAAGNLVLTGPSTWQWASGNESAATIAATGATATATSLLAGETKISVTETESGKTASVSLAIGYPVVTTASGLQYQEVVVGNGRLPVTGKRVAVYYKGTFKDGTVFDSRLSPASPFIFTIGVGQVIAGWDEGLATMREGGKRKLFVPSNLAYGETGSQGGTIPPNTPIDFEVELLEIEP